MTETEFRAALARCRGFDRDDAAYYASAYPPSMWREILDWAKAPPALDACDDVEADENWGTA